MSEEILIVEDDRTLAEVIATSLERVGFTTRVVDRGDAVMNAVARRRPDLVVLDLMLPGLDGLEVCRLLREQGGMPIVILSARADEVDRVIGLELGADDYIAKPFSTRELAARVKAVLRRGAIASDADDVARVGPLEVDASRRTVRLHGEVIDLTYTQFELLQAFAQSPRRVFSRVELANRAKGGEASIDPRSINAHVQALRRKLATRDGAPEVIRAVPGVGYALDPPPDW